MAGWEFVELVVKRSNEEVDVCMVNANTNILGKGVAQQDIGWSQLLKHVKTDLTVFLAL